MMEPTVILPHGTRIKTTEPLGSTRGYFVSQPHLEARRSGAIGAICGIVGGHGGDVYWVAHHGATCMAVYGWWDFNLEPAKDPCVTCKGSGVDWAESKDTRVCTVCRACSGTAERIDITPVSAWEHIDRDDEL